MKKVYLKYQILFKNYGVLIITLILILYSYTCRIDNCNNKIEVLQKQIEYFEKENEKLKDGLCFKNHNPYCIQYKSDKQLIDNIVGTTP